MFFHILLLLLMLPVLYCYIYLIFKYYINGFNIHMYFYVVLLRTCTILYDLLVRRQPLLSPCFSFLVAPTVLYCYIYSIFIYHKNIYNILMYFYVVLLRISRLPYDLLLRRPPLLSPSCFSFLVLVLVRAFIICFSSIFLFKTRMLMSTMA